MKVKDFIQECQKWDVFKKLSIYIVTSWLLIQVVATTKSGLGLPDKIETYLLLLLLIGLPIYAYYVWRYQISPFIEKSVDDPDALDIDLKYKQKFYRIYMSVLGATSFFVLIICGWLLKLIVAGNDGTVPLLPPEQNKIAVLKFGNNIGDERFDHIGEMAADWIVHGITQYKAGQVIPQDVIDEYYDLSKSNSSANKQTTFLKDFIKPEKVIKGDFYVDDEELIIQCSITDGSLTSTLISFEQAVCDIEDPLACIDEVKQRTISYLLMDNDSIKRLNLQETPPKYEAYQYRMNALERINDPREHLDLLNAAIAADPGYFEPKLLRIAHYYNYGDFVVADSLLRNLSSITGASKRQRNLLDMYQALLNGHSKNAYKYLKEEYNYARYDLPTNQSMMAMALQFVNKLEDVDLLYEQELPIKKADIDRNTHYKYRIYIKALADIERENYAEAINLLKPIVNYTDDENYKTGLLMAYVRSGQKAEYEKLLRKIALIEDDDNDILLRAYATVARELLLKEDKKEAVKYADKIVVNWTNGDKISSLVKAYRIKSDYGKLIEILEDLYITNKIKMGDMAVLAMAYYHNNEEEKLQKLITQIKNKVASFEFGITDYALAQFYSVTGNKEEALNYLRKAIAEGHNYTPGTFQNDPYFKDFFNTSEFQEIMTFWH